MAKPILFNTEMVQALIEGRKTNTRRIIKNKYENTDIAWFENKYGKRLVYMQNDVEKPVRNSDGTTSHKLIAMEEIRKPYEVGDILYVRETWWQGDILDENGNISQSDLVLYAYAADDSEIKKTENLDWTSIKWRPSIHMPKSLARIFLKVTDVRAERLQDMEIDDFEKEGVGSPENIAFNDIDTLVDIFGTLWDGTTKEEQYKWNSNPWVWVIEFERVES